MSATASGFEPSVPSHGGPDAPVEQGGHPARHGLAAPSGFLVLALLFALAFAGSLLLPVPAADAPEAPAAQLLSDPGRRIEPASVFYVHDLLARIRSETGCTVIVRVLGPAPEEPVPAFRGQELSLVLDVGPRPAPPVVRVSPALARLLPEGAPGFARDPRFRSSLAGGAPGLALRSGLENLRRELTEAASRLEPGTRSLESASTRARTRAASQVLWIGLGLCLGILLLHPGLRAAWRGRRPPGYPGPLTARPFAGGTGRGGFGAGLRGGGKGIS